MGKRIVKFLSFCFECVLECIYPHKNICLVCEKELDESGLCKECFNKITFFKKPIDIKGENMKVISVCAYSTTIKQLILNFKYKKNFYCGEFLSALIVEYINQNKIDFDLITYVPSTKKALKNRGFNQCKFISDFVAKKINKPVVKSLIQRQKEGLEQKKLSAVERKTNLIGVFCFENSCSIKAKTILLIDDVITTGYTLKFCRDVLIENGAKEVILLTIAKNSV